MIEAAADETVDNPEESSLETTGTDAGSETSDTGEEAESSETEQTSGTAEEYVIETEGIYD